MPRTLLVLGEKTFKIVVPDDAKITFGPFSPPSPKGQWDDGAKKGTLRIYQGTKENVVAVFSGVTAFRDLSLGYSEEVVREEGATIWKDDEHGYVREDKRSASKDWIDDPTLAIEAPKAKTVKKKK
jgi:hypothetical protein